MPALSPATQHVDWKAAETAVAAGVPIADVAQAHGIKFWTLWKRAQRGKWFIPSTAIKKAEKAARDYQQAHFKNKQASSPDKEGCPISSNGPSLEPKKTGLGITKRPDADEKTGALMLQTLERNDDRASLLASGIAVKALEKASKRKKPIELDTIAEVDKALMVTKRAAGKDKPDTAVTLALFGGHTGPMPEAARGFRVKVHEAETVEDC